jgi:hypothetical protein
MLPVSFIKYVRSQVEVHFTAVTLIVTHDGQSLQYTEVLVIQGEPVHAKQRPGSIIEIYCAQVVKQKFDKLK